jgi:alkyl sulfatase BDS1-like metallo-beta-lactamase superfamily hydrolase
MTDHAIHHRISAHLAVSALLSLAACTPPEPPPGSAATPYTVAVNRAFEQRLDLNDSEDFEQADRGRVAAAPAEVVKDSRGKVLFDPAAYDFVDGEAPPTVNPSLWRQARLNLKRGLYQVADGIYQLRGFDLANMTIIEGERGWILVDPLTNVATAAQALAFAREHLGEKPVTAVLITHSHIDHFGGVLGVVSVEDVEAGRVEVIAPEGFIEQATSENVVAGPAMFRRAEFMYALRVPRSPTGHVSTGLGIQPIAGDTSIIVPTRLIDDATDELSIDGVRFRFLNAPGTEAPAEFMFYLPDHQAFGGAEVLSRNMHNLYTLRGTKVRDAVKWSDSIHQAIEAFPDAEVYFGSHHWPIWGRAAVLEFLEKQRDMYRFIHDQTLRWANAGLTSREIAERIELPESLATEFYNRDYYGTLKHNSKAVYQHYFGWYSGNPAHLNPLPPVEAATRYVDYMGGAAAVIEKARASFVAGEYRWVAEVLNQVVFAEPENQAARDLLARAYQQLAYQAESGPWRDVYLSGAYELYAGPPDVGIDLSNARAMLERTPLINFMTAMSVRLKAEEAEGEEMTINIVFSDIEQSFVLELSNSVLHYREGEPDPDANATLEITHPMFLEVILGQAGIADLAFSDDLAIEGSRLDLVRFFGLLDRPDPKFPIVTP